MGKFIPCEFLFSRMYFVDNDMDIGLVLLVLETGRGFFSGLSFFSDLSFSPE